MLFTQKFRESSNSSENHNYSSKKGCSSSSSTHPLFPQPPISISSLSSSSSPSDASTPPDLKQHCNSEQCENGVFVKTEETTFQIEQLFEKPKETDENPPQNDSCPNDLFHEFPQSSSGVKTSNNSFSCFNRDDGLSKVYENSASAFDSQQGPSNLVGHGGIYPRSNSQDLTQSNEQVLSQSSSGALGRKSYDNISDKEMRKKLKNRESAQAARDRKKAKMLSLERQVSELRECCRLTINENQQLKATIQQLRANAYWSKEKPEASGMSPDSTGVISFPINAVTGPSHGPGPSDLEAYGRTNQYPRNLCNFGEYNQPPQAISGTETVEGGNVPSFSQMPIEAASDFHASNYGQNIWDGESLNTLPNSQHPGSFNVGDTGNYSDNSSMLG